MIINTFIALQAFVECQAACLGRCQQSKVPFRLACRVEEKCPVLLQARANEGSIVDAETELAS